MFMKISPYIQKHPRWSLFLIKFQALGPGSLLKRDSRYFPVKFEKILRTSLFTEHLRWQPLYLWMESIHSVKEHLNYHVNRNSSQPQMFEKSLRVFPKYWLVLLVMNKENFFKQGKLLLGRSSWMSFVLAQYCFLF